MPYSKEVIALPIKAAQDLLMGLGVKRQKLAKQPNSTINALEAALELCGTENLLANEPIRTIHHFSCTGGTLLAKCIASMANVLLLNEIDLHSAMPPVNRGKSGFTPTDMISLLRQGDQNISAQLVSQLFLSDLQVLREDQWKIGRSIVLRDHSHSHFLTGSAISDTPTLLELVSSKFPTRSIVTVRDPVDSWLPMTKQGWHKKISPSTFNEYCNRYLTFLQTYSSVSIVRYEDFVSNPNAVMKQICDLLSIEYYEEFQNVFDVFKFSGDSGRTSDTIAYRERHKMNDISVKNFKKSKSYIALASQLGYRTED